MFLSPDSPEFVTGMESKNLYKNLQKYSKSAHQINQFANFLVKNPVAVNKISHQITSNFASTSVVDGSWIP